MNPNIIYIERKLKGTQIEFYDNHEYLGMIWRGTGGWEKEIATKNDKYEDLDVLSSLREDKDIKEKLAEVIQIKELLKYKVVVKTNQDVNDLQLYIKLGKKKYTQYMYLKDI